jgi:hypothetical protein
MENWASVNPPLDLTKIGTSLVWTSVCLGQIQDFQNLYCSHSLNPHVSDSILSVRHRLPAADVACGSGEQPEREAEQLEP